MLDLTLIRKLVRIMTGAGVTELEVDDAKAGLRVRLKRGVEAVAAPPAPVVQLLPGSAQAAPAAPQAPQASAAAPAPAGLPPGTMQLTSPMVGTFYRASAPEADPYVEVGGRVSEDTVVCIIEAMKVMNEIKAEVRGEVIEALVENGEPVEFGQPLFLIRRG